MLTERYRRELHIHCYRMLASYEDAQDLTQETFLRAWRSRHTFAARSSLRTWLYRIATNACLDFLDRRGSRAPTPSSTQEGAPPGTWRCLLTWTNRQPAIAAYLRRPDDESFEAFALDMLTIEDGIIAEIVSFPLRSVTGTSEDLQIGPVDLESCARLDLPPSLPG